MENNNVTFKYQKLVVPQKILIENYHYSFKKELYISFISYRCINRNCKASIKLSLENAKKILNKETDDIVDFKINYNLVGEHANHPKGIKKTENLDNIKNENEIKELAKILIKTNLESPLSFYLKNLESNKIKLLKTKIKKYDSKIKRGEFPKRFRIF